MSVGDNGILVNFYQCLHITYSKCQPKCTKCWNILYYSCNFIL